MTNDLNPLAKVYLGSNTQSVHKTPRFKHTNNPVWESTTEFLCSDKPSSMITVKVIDDREILKDPVVGYISVRLEDILEAKKEAGKDWWPLSGCNSGKLRLSAEWKPLNMAGSLHGADQYVPPIGVVRLWLKKATDVKCALVYSGFIPCAVTMFLIGHGCFSGTWRQRLAARYAPRYVDVWARLCLMASDPSRVIPTFVCKSTMSPKDERKSSITVS